MFLLTTNYLSFSVMSLDVVSNWSPPINHLRRNIVHSENDKIITAEIISRYGYFLKATLHPKRLSTKPLCFTLELWRLPWSTECSPWSLEGRRGARALENNGDSPWSHREQGIHPGATGSVEDPDPVDSASFYRIRRLFCRTEGSPIAKKKPRNGHV